MWRIKLSSFHLTSYFKFILDKYKTKLLSKADFYFLEFYFVHKNKPSCLKCFYIRKAMFMKNYKGRKTLLQHASK